MKFVEVVDVHIDYILCHFGLFVLKTDYFIELMPNTTLNAANNGYQHTFLLKSIPYTRS